MNYQNAKKLSKYIASVTAALTTMQYSKADIIYVDVNPDHGVPQFHNTGVDEFFDIIINGDSIFRVGNFNSYWSTGAWNGVWIEGVNTSSATLMNSVVRSPYYFTDPYPSASGNNNGYMLSALSLNDVISVNNDFSSWGWLGLYSGGSTGWGAGAVGYFENVTDKYVGAQFNIKGKLHYGWLRFDALISYSGFTFKDYAYQDCPNTPIKAGEKDAVLANTATPAINKIDGGETPQNIEFSIDLTSFDSTTVEHRLIIVKNSKAETFTVNDAKNVDSSSIVKVLDETILFTDKLNSTILDSDGDAITYNADGYRMFSFGIPDGINTNAIHLSSPSEVFLQKIINVAVQPLLTDNITLSQNGKSIVVSSKNQWSGKINVYSASGQLVFNKNIQEQSILLNLNHLQNGVYIVNIINENGEIKSDKIVL